MILIIPATITATVIESKSKVDTIANVIPNIFPFPMLTEDLFAGVDVYAVKLNGGEQENKNEDEDHFYDSIADNYSFSFDHDSPTIKEPSTKKTKTAKTNDTVSKPKGINYSREEYIALCKAFTNLSAKSIEGKENGKFFDRILISFMVS